MVDKLIDDAIEYLEDLGIVPSLFFKGSAGVMIIDSVELIMKDKQDSFKTHEEVAVYLLEGIVSTIKEKALMDNRASFHSTEDGRLITSVIASADTLQEKSLELISNARGEDVMEIYTEILQPLNLHCPTCSCETNIYDYEQVINCREEYLEKLKDVLGKSD